MEVCLSSEMAGGLALGQWSGLTAAVAIVLCSPLTKLYLLNYARPLIYTTFMSYPALAAIKVAYAFMARGDTEEVSLRPCRSIQSLRILALGTVVLLNPEPS